jgi:hypothetical protein
MIILSSMVGLGIGFGALAFIVGREFLLSAVEARMAQHTSHSFQPESIQAAQVSSIGGCKQPVHCHMHASFGSDHRA